jgi:hypothetical protein
MKAKLNRNMLTCDGCHAKLVGPDHQYEWEEPEAMERHAQMSKWQVLDTAHGKKDVCQNCLKILANLYGQEDLNILAPKHKKAVEGEEYTAEHEAKKTDHDSKGHTRKH